MTYTYMVAFVVIVAGCLLIKSASVNSNRSFEWVRSECNGCHFNQRNIPPKKFKSGQSNWSDEYCYGCHKDIDDIAYNKRNNIYDYRYVSLPVEDQRLMGMGDNPLPYLNAPLLPHLHPSEMGAGRAESGGIARVNIVSLSSFLNRPTGKCNGNGACEAPTMVAYTGLSDVEIRKINPALSEIPDETVGEKNGDIKKGRGVFSEKCIFCHSDSVASSYDAVGLSRFSAQWIYRYANGLKISTVSAANARNMPILALTDSEANNLYAFFKQKKKGRVLKLEKDRNLLAEKFNALPNSGVSAEFKKYMWTRFWRDAGCVHCHGLDGRARNKLNSDRDGLENWLTSATPEDLYFRLATRDLEKKHGVGASLPGMPMTGSPLPQQLIDLIGIWIKEGCINEDNKKKCNRNLR